MVDCSNVDGRGGLRCYFDGRAGVLDGHCAGA